MNLFIDTNVFLNFFHLSGEDIEELKKVVELIVHEQLTLYVTRQVCDEFHRNREVKIGDGVKQIPSSIKVKLPAYYRSHEKFKEFNAKVSDLDKEYAKFLSEVAEEIDECTLAADLLIAKIFEKATIVETVDDLIYAAVRRLRRGNPPGKKDRGVVGDELNWEALLSAVPTGQDLHIVSVDGDFASIRDNAKIKKYLADEWTEKKQSVVKLYRGLTPFFSEHFPAITLASDVAKTALIDSLASSGSFYDTHLAIGVLGGYLGSFTAQDGNKLIEILQKNAQVRWILSDPDVKGFYEGVVNIPGLDADSKDYLETRLADVDETYEETSDVFQ